MLSLPNWTFEVLNQFKLLILKNAFGTLDIDFSMFIGWVYIVHHIFDRSVYDELVSQPRIELSYQPVDSCEGSHFLHNFSLEGVIQIEFTVLELTSLNILFDELDRSAVVIVENVDDAILVEEVKLNKVIVLVSVNLVFSSSISTILTLFHSFSKLVK